MTQCSPTKSLQSTGGEGELGASWLSGRETASIELGHVDLSDLLTALRNSGTVLSVVVTLSLQVHVSCHWKPPDICLLVLCLHIGERSCSCGWGWGTESMAGIKTDRPDRRSELLYRPDRRPELLDESNYVYSQVPDRTSVLACTGTSTYLLM